MGGLIELFRRLFAVDTVVVDHLSDIERDAKKNTVGCIGSLVTLGLIICLAVAAFTIRRQQRLDREGTVENALVTTISRVAFGSTATYQYLANGKIINGTFGVSTKSSLKVGDTLPIRYLPTDPLESEVVGQTSYATIYVILSIFCVPAILVLFGTVNRWRVLSRRVGAFVYTRPEEAPEWATVPYKEARALRPASPKTESNRQNVVQNFNDDVELNALPTDKS